MLGQSEYGLYSLAASVIAYLTVLDLGFGNAIIRYTAKFRAEGKQIEQQYMFGMFLVLYTIIGIIAAISGGILSLNANLLFSAKMTLDEIERAQVLLWLMTFNLAITFPLSVWSSIMSAYERFVFKKMLNIIRSILNPIVMVVLLTLGYKAVAMVVVTTLFNVVTLLIDWWYCKHYLRIKVRFGNFDWGLLKEISIYSLWIFLNVIMDRIYWSTGQFVLGIYRGAVAIAVYAVAIHLQGMYMSFSSAISGVFLPKVTAMVTKQNSEREVSNLFIRTGRVQYIIMSFILCSFFVFGRPFIHIWAGVEYDDAYIICLLFFIPLTIPLIQNLGITILQARNQMKFRSVVYIIIAVGSLGISIPLARLYGGIGCAIGTSLALVFGQIIVMNIYYHKKQHIDIIRFWKEILKMSIAPVFFTAFVYLIIECLHINLCNISNFIVGATIFTLLYILLFWHFSMNKSERDLFLVPIKKTISKLS